jgi:hypothetical protein
MPNTYELISFNVLSSSAASVTFLSIPQTYTDLILKISARTDAATIWGGDIEIEINSSSRSTTLFSNTELTGSGSAATSARNTSASAWYGDGGRIDTAGNNADTFTSDEWYIANYTGANNKTASRFNASENNTSTAYINVSANYWRSSSAVNSLYINSYTGNYVSGSSFYLYGIKNS